MTFDSSHEMIRSGDLFVASLAGKMILSIGLLLPSAGVLLYKLIS